jgi:hypothetical protein
MPRFDGRRFRGQQQQDSRLAAIPVIIVTAVPEASVAGAAQSKEPVRCHALAGAMAKVLGRSGRKAAP